ncbi:hypothetical protein FHS78_000673 [Parvibaculum indicum]|uniref:ASCH domain-containing protein n=1 Tax=Parvibaculum indicum TaxID=562969 RepID=UPI00142253BC|nr:ASCH domain-containing protein [Parvibaculum indicum]NIJ40403.1 hypothetical protein [Parvibaculum indicum]
MKALSIMQPWAWLIVAGIKPVENRDWRPTNAGLRQRGAFVIHTGKKVDKIAMRRLWRGIHPVTEKPHDLPLPDDFPTGGFIGIADMTDVVEEHPSEWFTGRYGLVIENPRPFPFIAAKGALGFFDVPREIEEIIRRIQA